MRYALIFAGIVRNIAVFDTAPGPQFGQAVALDGLDPHPGIGWAWDGESFTPPEAPPAAPTTRYITKLSFRSRFTAAEKVALEIAALDDPTASMPVRQQAAGLRANLADQRDATYIDLDRADTRAGVQALEAAGLLASGRALAILDAPVETHERYEG